MIGVKQLPRHVFVALCMRGNTATRASLGSARHDCYSGDLVRPYCARYSILSEIVRRTARLVK